MQVTMFCHFTEWALPLMCGTCIAPEMPGEYPHKQWNRYVCIKFLCFSVAVSWCVATPSPDAIQQWLLINER